MPTVNAASLAGRFCPRIKCDFNHIGVRSFVLTGAPDKSLNINRNSD